MPYIDTHVHLDQEEFDEDRDEVIDRFRLSGVEAVICVGITADSSREAVSLAEAHKDVHAAVGIQPNYCAEAAEDDWDRVAAMADHPHVVAIGETGLDRHWDYTPPDVQQDYFDRHLRLAQQRELPVVIHCRQAEADLLPMLGEAVRRGPLQGVLHAYGGDAETAAECLQWGLYVSFAGSVTYTNKKFRPLRELAATIPEGRLLIETDAPYLVPHPLRGRQRRNEPAWIVHTAASLAQLRGVSPEELSTQTTANARRLFRLG